MPRIRTVKWELFEDEALGGCSRDARLLFIGLITWADDYGNHRAGAAMVRGRIFPYDDDLTNAKVKTMLDELATGGLVDLYCVEGELFLHLTRWDKHQRIDNAGKPQVPGPELANGQKPPSEPPPAPSKPPKAAAPTEDEAPLAHLLAELVAGNSPNGKRPKVTPAWASAERLLLEKDLAETKPPIDMDGRRKQVRYVIEWSQRDDFERNVMRSMPKLRARYDDLVTKAADHYKQSRNGGQKQSQKHERVRELLERGKAAAGG